MTNKDRKFCPEKETCKDIDCSKCKKIEGPLGHEINVNYLASIGRSCHCADCCDT